MNAWREGDRIRSTSGGGYNDVVPDDLIWTHIVLSAQARELTRIEFAIAVLRLRAIERAKAAL